MKKIALSFAILFLSLVAAAQPNSNETKAIAKAREATDKLMLSEYEYLKVKHLVEAKLLELNRYANLYQDDNVLYEVALKDIEKEFEKELLTIIPEKSRILYKESKVSLFEEPESITSIK